MEYLPVNDHISSSGQPTARPFKAIRDAGFSAVINLIPPGTENSLKTEAQLVDSLGMDYLNIPVAPYSPTQKDFRQFTDFLLEHKDRKTWVHCAVNARASSFLYRYRCEILGEDPEEVIWHLREIWEPLGEWKRFTFGE